MALFLLLLLLRWCPQFGIDGVGFLRLVGFPIGFYSWFVRFPGLPLVPFFFVVFSFPFVCGETMWRDQKNNNEKKETEPFHKFRGHLRLGFLSNVSQTLFGSLPHEPTTPTRSFFFSVQFQYCVPIILRCLSSLTSEVDRFTPKGVVCPVIGNGSSSYRYRKPNQPRPLTSTKLGPFAADVTKKMAPKGPASRPRGTTE